MFGVLKSLLKIDPLRRNHYDDTISDVALESKLLLQASKIMKTEQESNSDAIENGDHVKCLQTSAESVNCSSLSITQIRRLTPMFMLAEIDLSYNNLQSIEPLAGFMNLKTLILDNNRISDVSALYLCYSLNTLSAKNNQIVSLESFEKLTDCHLLASIDVRENEVESKTGFWEEMVNIFPRLEMLNGSPACGS